MQCGYGPPCFVSYGSLPSLQKWHLQTMLQHYSLIASGMPEPVVRQSRPACSGIKPVASAFESHCQQRSISSHRRRMESCPSRVRRPRSRRPARVVRAVGSPPQPTPGSGGGSSGGDPGSGGGDADETDRGVQPQEVGPDGLPPQPPFRQRTRLAEALLSGPSRVDNYFDRNPWRRLLWLGISFAAGFYCANTVSLSFGTLAVNDVVAAAVTLAFCEVISYMYYQAEVVGLPLALANSFKMGVIAALVTDALKLQG